MAYDGRYDDPKFINAFLADLNLAGEQLNGLAADGNDESGKEDTDEATDQASGSKSTSGVNTPAIVSTASSPRTGIRAPPCTPENPALKATAIEHLPSIDEDQDEGYEKLEQVDQQKESPQKFRPTASPFLPSSPIQSIDSVLAKPSEEIKPFTMFVDQLKYDLQVKNHNQYALQKFKARAEARLVEEYSELDVTNDGEHNRGLAAEQHQSAADTNVSSSNARTEGSAMSTVSRTETKSSSMTTEPFHDTQDESTAISDDSEAEKSSIDIIVDAPESPESTRSRKSGAIIVTADKKALGEPEAAEKAIPRRDAEPVKTNDTPVQGSREHETYFESWGIPSARSTSPARVRTVKLTDLPVTADFCLVQSLVYGGAIEAMILSQSSSGIVSASVAFTSADACEAYHNAHPNGLAFKYKGRRYVSFVDKGVNVDVISGVLQSYLDCGATRVVRAVGTDEEWSMKALHKIAEGRNGRRKVEAIIDHYRNESRDVIFRFTKIADAVAFRGELLRNSNWTDVDVQFAADPCEKATGIH